MDAHLAEVPSNWKDPDFIEVHENPLGKHVHEWRTYISKEVAAMWSTFTPEQKQALARQAQELADREHWD